MFKRMIGALRGNIEFFCYHTREVMVLNILWKEIKKKNSNVPATIRRDTLIQMINNIYEDEINA